MEIGAQLYNLRSYTQNETDFARSINGIAEIGYKIVQVSGIGAIAPEKIRKICDDNEMKIVLTHTNQERLLSDTQKVIEEHQILGCKYIGLGSMQERYRTEEWRKYFVEDYKPVAQKLQAAGCKLMYHNHDFEFENVNGVRLIDTLLEGFTTDELGITLDMFWVQAAGCDVVQWIERFKGRLNCVHLKDMNVHGSERRMAAVGTGNMNFEAIVPKFIEVGAEYALVEQDLSYGADPFECLKISYNNLKNMGFIKN